MGLRAQCVHQLVHARHGHGDDVHHLGLATLEQAGAMRRRQDGDFAAERTKVARTTTVDAQTFFDDPLADSLLGEAAYGLFHFTLAPCELGTLATQLLDGFGSRSICCCVALGLRTDRDGLGHTVGGDRRHCVEHVLRVIELRGVGHRHDGSLGRNDRGDELTLQRDGFLDPHLAGLEPAGVYLLVDLRCAGLVVR